jgi:hypothetical protein
MLPWSRLYSQAESNMVLTAMNTMSLARLIWKRPRPRRPVAFAWVQELMGTSFIANESPFAERWATRISDQRLSPFKDTTTEAVEGMRLGVAFDFKKPLGLM